MNKILIIIQREFLNRVSKKSFILLTILMPFIFAALIFVPALLSTVKSDEVKQVVIIDHTQKYIGQFKDDESYHFSREELEDFVDCARFSSPDKKCCPNTEVILPA